MWCPNSAGLSIQPNPTSLKVINKHTIIFYLFQNEEGEGGGQIKEHELLISTNFSIIHK